jgi:hypothetical protein
VNPIRTTVVGAVNGSTIPLDVFKTPFQVSIVGSVVSGAVSYKLHYTYDDVQNPVVVPAWIDHGLMTGKTAAFDTVINAAPVTAIRIVNAGTGTVGVCVIQAG